MEYLKISPSSSTEISSLDIEDSQEAKVKAVKQAKRFTEALGRIVITSDDDIKLSIGGRSSLIETGEQALANAIYKDYQGEEHKIKFGFGQSSTILSSSKANNPSLEVEINPQNIEAVIKLMNDTATKLRDSNDKKKLSEDILGELKNGLENIANIKIPSFAQVKSL